MQRLVKSLLESYYCRLGDVEIPNLGQREVAFFYESKVIRHRQFNTWDELKRYLCKYTPLHVFYSVALYSDPRHTDMEMKGWLGADIVIDIDADKYKCNTYRDCMVEAYHTANYILDILKGELGLTPKVRFSGRRGYHIVVEDPEWRQLDKDGRQNLLEFLLHGAEVRPATIGIYSVQFEPRVRRYRHEEPFDREVLLDVHRLIRFERSIHGKTGLAVIPTEPLEDVDKLIERASWAKGALKVEVTETTNSGDIFSVEKTGVVTLPAQVALYMLLTGRAQALRGV